MNDRQLLHLARQTLTVTEFDIWFTKHYRNLGRRTGSHELHISQEQWRHRLHTAETKLAQAITENT